MTATEAETVSRARWSINVRKERALVQRWHRFVLVVVAGVIVTAAATLVRTRARWGYMIDRIDKHVTKAWGAGARSGMSIALAAEYSWYGWATFYGYTSFPVAVQHCYYSTDLHACMIEENVTLPQSANGDPAPNARLYETAEQYFVPALYARSRLGVNDGGVDESPQTLVCQVLANYVNKADCYVPCRHAPINSTAFDVGMGAAQQGASMAMIGGIFGPEGAVVGGVLGALVGGGLAAKSHADRVSACEASGKGVCYVPTGMPQCDGTISGGGSTSPSIKCVATSCSKV